MNNVVKSKTQSAMSVMTGVVVASIVLGCLMGIFWPMKAKAATLEPSLDVPLAELALSDPTKPAITPEEAADAASPAVINPDPTFEPQLILQGIPAEEQATVWENMQATATAFGLSIKVKFVEFGESVGFDKKE